ncbi:MAG: DUF5979 domain-containing protein [Corynebacterium sp.]|nr:DUF5979 domain-containing protein [Corynebacterium sp.]
MNLGECVTRNLGSRVFAAIVAVLAVLLSILQMPVAQAQEPAQAGGDSTYVGVDRTQEYITEASVTRSSGKAEDPLYAGDWANFKFTWKVPEGAQKPKANDFIAVQLPKWLKFTEAHPKMTYSHNNKQEIVANCDQNVETLKCVFTDFVERNSENLQGGYEAKIQVREVTSIDQTEFPIGKINISIEALTKHQNHIGKKPGTVNNNKLQPNNAKFGWSAPEPDKVRFSWMILVVGNGGKMVVRDVVSKPQRPFLNGSGKSIDYVRVRDMAQEGEAGGNWNLISDSPRGTAQNLAKDRYTLEWSETPEGNSVATVTFNETKANEVYRIALYTMVPLDAYQNGQKVANEAEISGVKDALKGQLHADYFIRAYASGDPTKGGIIIHKLVKAPEGEEGLKDLEYTVRATWDGGQKDLKLKGTTNLEAENNPAPAVLDGLNPGTKVTLTELDLPGDKQWQDPVFGRGKFGEDPNDKIEILEDGRKAVVEIVANTAHDVLLTNSITPKGTFEVRKIAEGLAGNDAQGRTYSFSYECSDKQRGEVRDVPANEAKTVEATFTYGTTCTVTELSEQAGVEHYDVLIPAPQQVTINAAKSTVSFLNKYTAKGSFEVVKELEINGANPAEFEAGTFDFGYVCGDESGEITGVTAGQPRTPGDKTFPVGTKCTITEKLSSAQREGYTLQTPAPVTIVIGNPGQVVPAHMVNTYTRDVGKFKIWKQVTGDGNFGAEKFDIAYKCGAAEEVTVQLGGNEEHVVENIPTGTVCKVWEQPGSADRAGYTPAVVLTLDGELNDTVTISKDKEPTAVVTNNYTQNKGGFTISKSLLGDGAALAPKEFKFKYTCSLNDKVVKEGEASVEAGKSTTITDVPELAQCQVKELDASAPNTDWAHTLTVTTDGIGLVDVPQPAALAPAPAGDVAPAGDEAPAAGDEVAVPGDEAGEKPAELAGDEAPAEPADQPRAGAAEPAAVEPARVDGDVATFTIGNGTTHVVKSTNTYTRHRGTFSIAKTVKGDLEKLLKAKEFAFDVTCKDGQSTTVLVPGDGRVTPSGMNIPVGTECAIKENVEQAQLAGFDLKAPEAQTITITAKDQVIETSFTNEYSFHTGTFAIAKNVKGLPADKAAEKEFTFTYKCTDRQEGELKVKGDGKPVDSGKQIRTGSECSIFEVSESAQVKGFTLKIADPQVIKIDKKGDKATVTFTNTYDPIPNVPGPFPPGPGDGGEGGGGGGGGWIAFIPFIPLLFGNAGSSDNGGNVTADQSAQRIQQGEQAVASGAPFKRVLANTGASVIGIGVVAIIITAAGIFLAVRGRKNRG